jgi:two-component system, NarL family, response regulator LiaR
VQATEDVNDGQVQERSEPLRAIVADDDAIARHVIKEALQRAGLVVIAEAQNGREAVELTMFYRPDIVVMDVVMPGLDGLAATRQIVKEQPDQLVVLLTSADEEEMGLVGLRSGAAGFLTKNVDVDAIPRALVAALEGEAAISRRLATRLIDQLRRVPESATGLRPVKSPLTPREWEVVDLLYEGLTTEQMATTLVLSTETVRSHVKNLMRKLDARTRAEAVTIAQRMRGGLPDVGA